jgi:hypothetical protein
VTIDICEGTDSKTSADVAPVRELINRCTNITFLHLALRPEMACHASSFASALRGLPHLRQLELKGVLRGKHSLTSVSVLLQSTRNLEVLSLSLLPLLRPGRRKRRYFSSYEHMRNDGEDDDYIGQVYVPHRPWKTDIRCFRHRLRRINLVGYRGSRYERMLAKFLLSKAQALVEFSVSLAPVRSLKGDEITRELTSWRCRRRTRVICT